MSDLPPHVKRLGEPTHTARLRRRPLIQIALGRIIVLFIILGIITVTPGILCGVMAAWFLVETYLLMRLPTALVLAPGGLVQVRRGTIDTIKWNDLEAVQHRVDKVAALGRKLSSAQAYTLYWGEGQRRTYNSDHYADLTDLGIALQQAHIQQAGPRLVNRFEKGKALEFGPVTANQHGLTLKSQQYAWDDLRFEEDGLYQANGRRVVAVADIPNAHLLRHVIETRP